MDANRNKSGSAPNITPSEEIAQLRERVSELELKYGSLVSLMLDIDVKINGIEFQQKKTLDDIKEEMTNKYELLKMSSISKGFWNDAHDINIGSQATEILTTKTSEIRNIDCKADERCGSEISTVVPSAFTTGTHLSRTPDEKSKPLDPVFQSNDTTASLDVAAEQYTEEDPEDLVQKSNNEELEDSFSTTDDWNQKKHFLSPDTFSFFMLADCETTERTMPVLYAALVLLVQFTIYVLILFNVTDPKSPNYNFFAFPPNIDLSTRIAEIIAILLSVGAEEDTRTAIRLLLDGHSSCYFESPGGYYISRVNWNASVYTRAIEGLLGLTVTFILIMRSNDVVDLLLNFSAISFVANLDDIAFGIAQEGLVGPACTNMAYRVNETHYTRLGRRHKLSNVIRMTLFVLLFLPFTIGWIWVVISQNMGTYLPCTKIFVQFGDTVQNNIGALSGQYKYDRLSQGYKLHLGEEIDGSAKFQFCKEEEAWTFKYNSNARISNEEEDPCSNWIIRSSRSESYQDDIIAAASSKWFIRNEQGREIIMEHMYVSCSNCDGTNFCGRHGHCNTATDTCECYNERYGLQCNFFKPCETLQIDERFGRFSGYRDWSETFATLYSSDGALVEINSRPVYSSFVASSSNTGLIIFSGRRWILTDTSFMDDLDGSEVTKDNLVEYLGTIFHPFFSNYSVSFMSNPSDVGTASDSVTPVGSRWFHTVSEIMNSVSFETELDIALLCSVCNSSTNPCLYDGVCSEGGECDCSANGASGVLCQTPPIGNGFCDARFNIPEFNYDGGDCCRATCEDDKFICGTSKENEYPIGYCQCSDPRHTNCPNGVGTCWLPRSQPIFAEIDFAQSDRSVSMSSDATILAIGEARIDRVRVFHSAGANWIQIGESLEGLRGSQFGAFVSLSGNGQVLAVGSPNLRNFYGFDTDGEDISIRGRISVFRIRQNGDDWKEIFETPNHFENATGMDEFIHTYRGSGELGSSLTLNQDGTILIVGFPDVQHRSGSGRVAEGGIKSFVWNVNTNSFEFHTDTFINTSSITVHDWYEYRGHSVSISRAGDIVAFDTWGTGMAVEIWKNEFTEYSSSWRKLGQTIEGFDGKLSDNGQILAVSKEMACLVYSYISDLTNWTRLGDEALNGTCVALSSDGQSLATIHDAVLQTYDWNGTNWNWQGEVTAGVNTQVVMAGVTGGEGINLVVRSPSENLLPGNRRGEEVNVYGWQKSSSEKDETCLGRNASISVVITLDANPNETLWEVRDYFTQKLLLSAGPYEETQQFKTIFNETIFLPGDVTCFQFSIFDLAGDGMCCKKGFGSYSIYYGGQLQRSGGQFHWSETTRFGHCPNRQCATDQSRVTIESTFGKNPHNSSWLISDRKYGNTLVRSLPRGGRQDYIDEVCIDDNVCVDFHPTRPDYEVMVDGEVGEEFSGYITFAGCDSKTVQPQRNRTICVSISTDADAFQVETQWALYEIGSLNVEQGNQSSCIDRKIDSCYMWEISGVSNDGASIFVAYSLFMDEHEIISSHFSESLDQQMFGNCENILSQFDLNAGETLTCSDDLYNFCSAPASCASDGIYVDTVGANALGSTLYNGEWVTSGGFTMSFSNDCTVLCFGSCRSSSLSCSDSELPFRVEFIEGNSAASYVWNVSDSMDNILVRGSPYPDTSYPDHFTTLAQKCIPADRCITFSCNDVDSGYSGCSYNAFVGGRQAFSSGNYEFGTDAFCPHLSTGARVASVDTTLTEEPNNSNCSNAEALSLELPMLGYREDAIVQYIEGCGEAGRSISSGLWYSLSNRGSKKGVYIASLREFNDSTRVAVFAGACYSLDCIDGISSARGEQEMRLRWDSALNTDYYIVVYGGTRNDKHEIRVDFVAYSENDECTGATSVILDDVSHSATVSGSTEFASQDELPVVTVGTALPECVGSLASARGAWFSIVGTGSTIIANLCNSEFDTQVAVFVGSCNELICMAHNDDGCTSSTRSLVAWNSTANMNYMIFVYGYGGEYGNFVLMLSDDLSMLTPKNDECINASPLILADSASGSTEYATQDSFTTVDVLTGCKDFSTADAKGVWFSVVGTGTRLAATLCGGSDYDTQIAVFSGSCNALTCEAHNDDYCGLQSSVTWNSTSNTSYFIFVYGHAGKTGNYVLEVVEHLFMIPPNDECFGATHVALSDIQNATTFSGSTSFATQEATNQANHIPECEGVPYTEARGVWYSVMGFTESTLVADLCESDYDTQIAIFSGLCGNFLECEAHNDDDSVCPSLQSRVTWNSTANTIYFIFVYGFGDDTGDYVLKITEE